MVFDGVDRLMAQIKISTDYDMPWLVERAGGNAKDPLDGSFQYRGGWLVVPGVSQEALDTALGDYENAYEPDTAGPVPAAITLRQLLIAAVRFGWITEAEAEAWAARSSLPAPVSDLVASLPVDQRAEARLTLLTMTHAYRDDTLMTAVAGAVGASDTDIDRFFRVSSRI